MAGCSAFLKHYSLLLSPARCGVAESFYRIARKPNATKAKAMNSSLVMRVVVRLLMINLSYDFRDIVSRRPLQSRGAGCPVN